MTERIAALALTALSLSLSTSAWAGTAGPVVSPVRATLVGTVNVKTAAASKSNQDLLAAFASARPALLPAHLLPNGRRTTEGRGVAGLPRPAANAAVAGSDRAAGGLVAIGGFTGITEGANSAATGSELEPPDQGMAANDGIVGEVVNNTIQFFKDGQPITAALNNATFFNAGNAQLSDPHITFDPSVQRWFVDELTYGGPSGYGFYLAVSVSSDPTGSYNVYFVPSFSSDIKGCGRSGCFPDYPQVGYDSNAFYITADLFGTRRFVGAAIYALPKSELVANRAFTTVRFVVPDFVVQPAVPAPGEPFSFANNGTEYLMTARNILNNSQAIRVYELANTFNIVTAPSSLTLTATDLQNAEAYGGTVPSTEPDVIGPYGRSQKATSAPLLDGGYNAFSANVKMAGGKLYAALTTGSMDGNGLARDIVAWFKVDVANKPTIAGQGYIVPPDGYSISYPGLALKRGGRGYIGFSITSPYKGMPGGYPSTAVVPFDGMAAGTSITVTGAGATSDDGFTGYGAPNTPAGVGRWGDFASATVDAKTGVFYTANEFIPDPSVYPRGVFANWGTFITAIKQ